MNLSELKQLAIHKLIEIANGDPDTNGNGIGLYWGDNYQVYKVRPVNFYPIWKCQADYL